MYNYYKTNQARQMREYMDARIKEVEKEMESMKKDFIKFQRKNNYYDPDRQLESTIRYMANMQTAATNVAPGLIMTIMPAQPAKPRNDSDDGTRNAGRQEGLPSSASKPEERFSSA